ncbi:hypothetical protein BDY19DRAFT_896116 [Irpex rosettiformis]|uniref:Uncharacterized protein n=1 Tax=Irpex rosettiformis TaxID=378272 RepID=A0ACB8TUK2_9APHY|nr:hypothetical protein BDY19DRAFT_896116 [Irpex rosettiformis]
MVLRPALSRPRLHAHLQRLLPRCYATVEPVTLLGKAPEPPQHATSSPLRPPSALDALILSELRSSSGASLPGIVENYNDRAGHVLETSLPYEPRPNATRRVTFNDSDGVVMVAHAIRHGDEHKVALCTGFALNLNSGGPSGENENTVILSCAHTIEEMRNSRLFASLPVPPHTKIHNGSASVSGSFVMTSSFGNETSMFHPVQNVFSSLHRSDLVLLSTNSKLSTRPLPVSPYPAQPGAAVRAHVVVQKEPEEGGWSPWIGGTWSKWVRGTVLGYRDFAGREAQPGTYDGLNHMLFKPLPTPGSSGGPIVDEESGAVVGVMLGTRMDNAIEGLRGWGVPSETIFEMFGLPGLKLKR